jgi:LysR family transcriptional regulator, glycine cleavage system transcriptional activator
MQKLPPLAAIRAFEAAGRHENFSRAAEELGMSQAAISYQIRQLEDRLGRPLFIREKGRARLSETGRRLLPMLSTAFVGMADAFSALHSDDIDVLTVSAPTTFGGTWLSARIGRFQLQHSDLAVRLSHSNVMIDFSASDFDVAIRVGGGVWPGLRSDFLFQSHVTPICSPAFMESHSVGQPADILNVERLAPNDPWWAGWFSSIGVSTAPTPQRGLDMESQVQEASAVQGGYGTALMTPMFWRAELESGRLVQPFDHLYLPGSAFWLVHPEHRIGVRKIERFREWLHDELKSDRHLLSDALWQPLS